MQRTVTNLQLTYLEHEGHVVLRQTERITEFLRGMKSAHA